MLFHSLDFILGFLPIALVVFVLLQRCGQFTLAIAFLTGMSLLFYAWDNAEHLLVLILSIATNYGVGVLLTRPFSHRTRGFLLAGGVMLNLAALCYFKYAGFLLGNVVQASGDSWVGLSPALPVGISFFTFTQIAFLVDAYRRAAEDTNPLRYTLFVTFFPHLIAGPILHHAEMMPQFRKRAAQPWLDNLSVGLTVFAIGLFKKVVLADTMALGSTPVFNAAAEGFQPDLVQAWGAALSYAFQIYFDFSGYSDMAIGLARMFGINMPINFASPYKATSFIDFWRRWHITLSRFLRDYVYIPLGGGRQSPWRRHLNVLLTMLIGGIWHGAGWTFILWGGLHGLCLVANHLLRAIRPSASRPARGWARTWIARGAMVVAITLLWVPFRAESLEAACRVWAGMAGWHGLYLPKALAALPWPDAIEGASIVTFGTYLSDPWIYLAGIPLCLAIVWSLPATHEWMRGAAVGLPSPGYPATSTESVGLLPAWRPVAWAGVVVGLLLTAAATTAQQPTEFIYFKF